MRLNLNKVSGVTRRTRERELILDRIQSLPGHFGAEELWHSLVREGQRVARATVYRTLEMLVEQGILQRVQLDEGGAKYEVLYGRPPHAHLFCLGCGRLVDYPLPALARLPRQVRQSRGFHAAHLLLRICGYCRVCSASMSPRRASQSAPTTGKEGKNRKSFRKP